MIATMVGPDPELVGIGHFRRAGGDVGFEIGWPEFGRDTVWARRLLEVWAVGAAEHAVLTIRNSEGPWLTPLVHAMRDVGVVFSNAEPFAWDSRRVAALMRLLSVKAVVGLPGETAEVLLADDDTRSLLAAVPVIWARPDAVEQLRGAGLEPAEMAMLGPALALSCPERTGLHLDPGEWHLTAGVAGPALTVVGDRRFSGRDIELNIDGTIDEKPCACGLPGPRIRTE
ncbi:hypothetical protein K7711_40865 [Nocardia sp. CA2R105]|uniref:hypothetical protein n=1 Tax=Nocardia coffeae TaxID=2873381 RepID=UPI001CA62518|nr:hypothetical protein [Nocardia coffeae]MBY8862880.1 hypothetical protein [Nocardia coffeae]